MMMMHLEAAYAHLAWVIAAALGQTLETAGPEKIDSLDLSLALADDDKERFLSR